MPLDETLSFRPLRIAVLTISDTRVATTDRSGDLLVDRLLSAGHHLASRKLIPDSLDEIERALRLWIEDETIHVVLCTGGTGITYRDVTPEAFVRVLDKELTGFGELFRMLSYDSVGTSTMQSRAVGGVAGGTYLFALPGSPSAVAEGWDRILGSQLDSRFRPCNLVDVMPRLRAIEQIEQIQQVEQIAQIKQATTPDPYEASCCGSPRQVRSVSDFFQAGLVRGRGVSLACVGEVAAGPDGLLARFSGSLTGGQLEEVRFKASTCVTLVAYCEVLAQAITGLSLAEAMRWDEEALVAALPGVPAGRTNRAGLAIAALRKVGASDATFRVLPTEQPASCSVTFTIDQPTQGAC